MGKYEVLAPAGSLDALKDMIAEKVDAIYVGLMGCSSRPSKCDMSMQEVSEAVGICHESGVKLYVAINANIRNSDVDKVLSDIYKMDEMGVDAVILSELALAAALQGKLRNAVIHASTLMGIYNIDSVRLLKRLGVVRVIFYANLYFDEMADIINAVPDMEYELVAEGGTCFNDIRQCRLPHGVKDKEHILCCRKKYALIENGEFLSEAKPISEYPTRTAEIVGLYMAVGITSFKIEGRTVSSAERIPMIHTLRENINKFQQSIVPRKSFLHYFVRSGLEMR